MRKATPLRAMAAVLACFLVAGALAPLWDRAAGAYTSALLPPSQAIARFIDPVGPVGSLERSGTLVRVAGLPAGPGSQPAEIGRIETTTISFYLPFIVLLLAVAWAWFDVVSLPEIALITAALFLVHLAGLSLGVQIVAVDALRAAGLPCLVPPIESAVLRTLHHTYCYSGAELWSGLVVGLVLLRSRPGASATLRRLSSSPAVALACVVLVLPAALYVGLAPSVRRAAGADCTARLTAARAALRAGNFEGAGILAHEALDPGKPDPDAMLILGAAAERSSPAEAREWYRKVVAVRPDALAYLRLARVEIRLGDPEAAKAAYYAALSVDPDNEAVYRALGDLYLGQGDAEAARTHYDLAERLKAGAAAPATWKVLHAR